MTETLDLDMETKAPSKASEFAEMYTWHEGMDWNPVERVMLERRSIRKYKDKQVPEKLVRRILEAGRFAPSAGNSQSWRFVVIRDREMIESMEKYVRLRCRVFKFFLNWRTSPLGKLAWFYTQVTARVMPNLMHPIPYGAISLIADGKLKLFHGAPTVILIFMDKRGAAKPEVDCGHLRAEHGAGRPFPGFGHLLGGVRGAASSSANKWCKKAGRIVPLQVDRGHRPGLPGRQSRRHDRARAARGRLVGRRQETDGLLI